MSSFRGVVAAAALGALAAGCVTYAEPPPSYQLIWAKHEVTLEAFTADIDACNVSAEAAAEAVEPHRGQPENDAFPPVWVWRWIVSGERVTEAIRASDEACYGGRGYVLAFVTQEDATNFDDIVHTPVGEDEAWRARNARVRDEQLRFLHRLATVERPLRARVGFLRRGTLLYRVRPADA